MSAVQDLLAKTMRLPKKDRARLAFDLLQSLDSNNTSLAAGDWEKAWSKEIEKRCDERDRGKTKTHDVEEVIRANPSEPKQEAFAVRTRILDLAKKELLKAIDWYDRQLEGLGGEFLNDF